MPFGLIIADVYASVYLLTREFEWVEKDEGNKKFSVSFDSFSRHANFSWRDTLLLTYRFGWHGARSFGIESWWRSREGNTERRKKKKKEKI